MVYTDPWGEYALDDQQDQFNPTHNMYDFRRVRSLVNSATGEGGAYTSLRGEYDALVVATGGLRSKDWQRKYRDQMFSLYNQIYGIDEAQNNLGWVILEGKPESLRQNFKSHLKDFATAEVDMSTRVKTGAAASGAALVGIAAAPVIAATGIYGATVAGTALAFGAVTEGSKMYIEGPEARLNDIKAGIARPWVENDPVAAAAQVGTVLGVGMSFSPAVRSAIAPVTNRMVGFLKGLGDKTLGRGAEAVAGRIQSFVAPTVRSSGGVQGTISKFSGRIQGFLENQGIGNSAAARSASSSYFRQQGRNTLGSGPRDTREALIAGRRFVERLELHHRFVPNRWRWVPKQIRHHQFNLKKVFTLDHALKDPYRYQFLPKWVKEAIEASTMVGKGK